MRNLVSSIEWSCRHKRDDFYCTIILVELNRDPSNEPVFISYRWEFRIFLQVLVKDSALGTWVTAHVMRRIFASLFAQAGVSL